MFNNKFFYHEGIKRAIIAFGTIFNGITIRRKDASGATVQAIAVPLSYGPKHKFLSRIREVEDLEDGRHTQITLPRMAFEIGNLQYDGSRKLPITQKTVSREVDGPMMQAFTATPYSMSLNLSVMTKNQEDGLQIVEQILPYFNPDFSVTVMELPQLGIKRDIQIHLDNVQHLEEYEGAYTDDTMIVTWDLQFTMKINFYGYVSNAALIKKSIQNVYASTGTGHVGDRITVTPDPADATPESDYGFITEFEKILRNENIF
jgi:hypothetical protein